VSTSGPDLTIPGWNPGIRFWTGPDAQVRVAAIRKFTHSIYKLGAGENHKGKGMFETDLAPGVRVTAELHVLATYQPVNAATKAAHPNLILE